MPCVDEEFRAYPAKHMTWAEELGDRLGIGVQRQRGRLAGDIIVLVFARIPKHSDRVVFYLVPIEHHLYQCYVVTTRKQEKSRAYVM